MSSKLLILTVGLPRSGKSTWAKKYSKLMGTPIVNPDSIRLALHGKAFEPLAEEFVWAIAKIMVRSLFLSGHEEVILDATNITKKRRDMWKSPDWITKCVLFNETKEECIKRTTDPELIKVITRMNEQFELLDNDEEYFG